jgi:hypothetical protein
MYKDKQANEEPTVAPGIDNDEELEQSASTNEVTKGDYTQVTTLTLDDLDEE